MGIRKYRGQIVCDKRWPDGSRTTRVCANRTQAKQLLDRINASIADGSWREFKEKLKLRDHGKLTLQDFSKTYIEEYAKVRNKKKSWKRKQTSLNALNRYIGTLDLNAISPAYLHNYVRRRKREGLSEGTINKDLNTIRHLLSYAEECGVIESNPITRFKNLRENQKERPRFTDEQVDAVINAVRPDCRPLYIFIRETGCRREEALSLQHWQVQRESRLVVFSEDTKSRKFRYVPLTEAAIEAVDTLQPIEDCPYVFYSLKSGNPWYDCRKPWVQAREQGRVPGIQVKDLRRHYAISLAEDGAAMHDIQSVLGHASVTTTERHYAHFSPEHAAKKILKVLEGGRGAETKRKQRERVLTKIKRVK
ncbi:tyrosine-type recombinase/integrase [Acidobacteria bacterium AH-259-L09]|nr:tyrosine-type recombinase/integrase [Acidobacteria bacterium AH-259-L09]